MGLFKRIMACGLRFGIRVIFKTGTSRMATGPHITRYGMYRHLGNTLGRDWPEGTRCLSISGSRELCETVGLSPDQVIEVDYPEHSLLDLDKIDDAQFDVVISDQVLEHLEGDPQLAFSESLRILKPGGIALHTTCFVNGIHWGPEDYWRFSPSALRWLARGFSSVIDCGGWGNRMTWVVVWADMRFVPVPHATWHPLHRLAVENEDEWPIVTWIIARK